MDMEERQGRQGDVDHEAVQHRRRCRREAAGPLQDDSQQEAGYQEDDVDHAVSSSCMCGGGMIK